MYFPCEGNSDWDMQQAYCEELLTQELALEMVVSLEQLVGRFGVAMVKSEDLVERDHEGKSY